jgi:DNA-damage-inducible protein D
MSLAIAHTGDTSPFNSIRHYDDNQEYWLARELMTLMGYPRWAKFESPILQAIENLELTGDKVSDHFLPLMVKTQGRNGKDYRLSRYACYMVALSCDGRKIEVASAKKYFAIKTRQAEVTEQIKQPPKAEYALTPDNALNVIDLILKGSGVDPKLISGLKANVISKEFPQLRGVAEQTKLLLPVEVESRLVTATDLALEYSGRCGQHFSAKAMNLLLECKGFQVRNLNSNPNWMPTEKGKPYSKVVLQEAKNSNTTVQQLRWYMSVLEAV